MPPAVIEMLKTHGLVIRVAETKHYPPQKEYNEATQKYLGTAKLEDNLWGYKAGRPFPNIDPKDPKAGLKMAWNFQYHFLPEEYYYADSTYNFVNKAGYVERVAHAWWRRLIWIGRCVDPPIPEILPNPDGVSSKELLYFFNPKDLAGIAFFTVNYKSEKKDSDNFGYIPSLRRVRRMSGAMRTDPVIGSDIMMEDFQGFAGKVTEFDWKLIGQKKMLFMRNAGY